MQQIVTAQDRIDAATEQVALTLLELMPDCNLREAMQLARDLTAENEPKRVNANPRLFACSAGCGFTTPDPLAHHVHVTATSAIVKPLVNAS